MAPKDRADAVGYGQFVLAAAGLVLTVWPYVLPHLRRRQGGASVDELADRLAIAVGAQWTAAATDRGLRDPAPLPIRWRRCTEPVTSPPAAATTPRSPSSSFPPLPGLEPVTTAQLRAGTHRMLHRIYGGLASGRLILAGEPGSGKSSAAILLLLDALRYRDHVQTEHRAHIPVPVLFTLAGWNPETTQVDRWLTNKLTELPTLAGRHGRDDAARLLSSGRIAVILDGLDEIPEHHRPTALRALAEQATFRLVLLTRTAELATAAQHHILTGAAALELQPLTSNDAATYLRNAMPDPPPAPWHQLLITLTANPTAPITQALSNPLTITLLRDIYRFPPTSNSAIGPIDELLETARFPTPQHITNHLLDHAIATAYTPRPGEPPPRYTPQTAHDTLTVIAQHLRDHHTRDLAWWHIPTWVPDTHLILLGIGINTVIIGIPAALALGFADGLPFGLSGLLLGSTLGLAATTGHEFWNPPPGQLSKSRWEWTPGILSGSWIALLGGTGIGLNFGLPAGLMVGLVAGVAVGLTAGFTLGLSAYDLVTSRHPTDLWRKNFVFRLVLGLAFGVALALTLGLLGRSMSGLAVGFVCVLIVGIGLAPGWKTAISQIYLTVRHHTPPRLGRFLNDAHQRHLLRTVGSIYQFRHATLQDRLAPPSHTPPSHSPPSSPGFHGYWIRWPPGMR